MSNVSTAIDSTKNYFKKSGAKSPGDLLQLLRFPFWKAAEVAKAGEVFQITVLNSQKVTGVTTIVLPRQLQDQLSKFSGCRDIRRTPTCSTSKFRTVDGSCNNINNPLWGASTTPFKRLLKPYYENGFNSPIGWRYPHRIPSARLVSRELLSSVNITDDPLFTHMLMQWGQFMDHDMDLTPASQTNVGYGTTISCNNTCANQHPCFPIQIPAGDRRIRNKKCLTFIRSSAACNVGPREQINDLTSYIDASNVYGSSKNFSDALRDLTGKKGLLKTGSTGPSGKPFLPFNTDPNITLECGESESGSKQSCFLAGDIRANEQLGLSALHTIWMREHNRIAESLANLNPHWNGERIYQESRKIVGAELQHITFTEWLPKILGPQGMNRIGTYQKYDLNVDASIVNAFATAAFRFGHSIIQPELQRLDQSFQPIRQGNIPLHKAFFAPSRLINEGGIDPVLRGLFGSPTKYNGDTRRPMNTELTERLFEVANSIAMDLGALNIQRGRDHGLPGYNRWRSFCNLPMAYAFDDLANEIKRPEVRAKLQQLYSMPNYTDLFSGGLVEDPLPGSRLGPVFNCIISEQFKRLRSGDRFWYENPGQFTQQQLQELKKVCNIYITLFYLFLSSKSRL